MVIYMSLSNRLLFCTGEGIGNVCQTIPVIRTLKEVLGYDIDFWHAFGAFHIEKFIPYVDNWYKGNEIVKVNKKNYKGAVSTWWTKDKVFNLPLLNEPSKLKLNRSEVDTYMDIARDLGVNEGNILWHGNCKYTPQDKYYDVVIHNGYKYNDTVTDWSVKSYPQYPEVVKVLQRSGLSICSIGATREYIKGTIDETGLPLKQSLGIVKNAKIYLGNDSGIYHCSNALEVPSVIIFTAMSIEKNYDSRFHKYSTLIYRDDLECRPCQGGRKWQKSCDRWRCREIDPDYIAEQVLNILKLNSFLNTYGRS